MRYITTDNLIEGMILAQPLYGSTFGVLLADGISLNNYHIQKINEMGYGGVYINDKVSADLNPKDILDIDTRMAAVRSAMELLKQAEQKDANKNFKINNVRQEQLIMPVVDGLIRSGRRVIDVFDIKPSNSYIYYHAAYVMILSLLIGMEMGLSGVQLYELGLSALLHDVGNIFLPQSILNKPSRLTEQEFEIIKQHSQMGFDFLREHYDISIEACLGALQHHENFNGTGYPNRLMRQQISIYGRIIALTDVYDAMTSRRPYRRPIRPHEAMRELERNSGTMFDPEVIAALGRVVALYPMGSCVELSNEAQCIVVENHDDDLARPRVRTLRSVAGEPVYFDLSRDPACADLHITKVLDV